MLNKARRLALFTAKRSSRHLDERRRRSLRLMPESLETRVVLNSNIFASVATESALRADIAAADTNSFTSNIIELSASITLTDTAAGQLEITNGTSTPKSLTIEGQGTSPSSTVISGSAALNTRIFEIVGTGSATTAVVLKDLAIEDGSAHDGGVLGGTAALGGGILIDGGQVTLSNANIFTNGASGAAGAEARWEIAVNPEVPAVTAATRKGAASTWRPAN